jgi:methyl acetate hydrolase
MPVANAVDRVLAAAVESGSVPGAVALAADDHGEIYRGAFGVREIGQPTAMSLDTVFWLASMTKLVTSVAALQLVEQGRVGLDEPLATRIPELTTVRVLTRFDSDGTPMLRPPRRAITLRHLLTHTSGFSLFIWNADILRYQNEFAPETLDSSRKDWINVPLACDPGERWEYGISIDWVGQTIEAVSGQRLDDYFQAHIFGPLGMVDTSFVPGSGQQARLARLHARQPDGSLQPIAWEIREDLDFFEAGGGLYSTGPDYLRFARMLLGKGQLDGACILRAETVEEMSRNQIGDLNVRILETVAPDKSVDAEFFPGMVKKWGLGCMITTEPAPTGRSAGSHSWAGLANTFFWIDPTRRITGVLLTQVLPFCDPPALNLFTDFEGAIYAGPGS